MPGKHDPKKKFVSFSLTRELWYKITQYSQSLGMDRNSWAVGLFQDEMERLGVELTPENQAKADAETKAAKEARRNSWTLINRRGKRFGKKKSV